jgi:hypothetical protein
MNMPSDFQKPACGAWGRNAAVTDGYQRTSDGNNQFTALSRTMGRMWSTSISSHVRSAHAIVHVPVTLQARNAVVRAHLTACHRELGSL